MTLHQVLHYAFYGYGAFILLHSLFQIITGKYFVTLNKNKQDAEKISESLKGGTEKTLEEIRQAKDDIKAIINKDSKLTKAYSFSVILWKIAGIFTAFKIYFIVMWISTLLTVVPMLFYPEKTKTSALLNTVIQLTAIAIVAYKAFSPLFIV